MSSPDDTGTHSARMNRTAAEFDEVVTRLYQAQSRRLRGFLRSLGCDDTCLDDICQDAFLAVRLRLNQVEIDSLEAYLYRVATNRFHRLKRQRDVRDRLEEPPIDQRLATDWNALDRRHALHAAFDQLSARQRQVLFLRFDVDLSVSQTGAVLGTTEGTVKRATSDAKRRLRELLEADSATWEGEL